MRNFFMGSALVLTAAVSYAATTDTPAAHEFIQQYGRDVSNATIGPQRAVYSQHLEEAGFPKAAVIKDEPYGSHQRHRLDIFPPVDGSKNAPIVVFVHGGGFVFGSKGDGVIFDNVLDYFAARGMLGININYRLAPAHRWPAGTEDIAAVMAWLHANAAKFGGDPDNIYIIGHSAGAAHVAGYTFNDDLQFNDGDDGLRGSILVSGVYSADDIDAEHVYYGDAEADVKSRVPLAMLAGRKVPLFIIDAGLDYPRMQVEAVRLTAAVCKRDGVCPRHQQVPGHNHYSVMHHVNTRDDSIAHAIADFIRRQSSSAAAN